MVKEERSATGIIGFDEMCQGGFVKDSINLILGNAGSGKTTFLLQFLFNGAIKFKENGLYVSFEQEEADITRTALKLGMDLGRMGDHKCNFLKFEPNMLVKDMQRELVKKVTKNDIQRICFDPINVFSMDLSKEISIRKQIYDFMTLLKQLDVCVLVAGESDSESGDGNRDLSAELSFCKYLVDGVIELYSSGISGSGDRAIRILKMRMTDHVRGPREMAITGSGLKINKG